MSSNPSDGHGRRPFVQAVYLDGELEALILDCPFGHFGEPCRIARHGRRTRKTGPGHALVVLRCTVHEHSFSVYPPGFVPYARRQLVDGPAQHGVPSLMENVDHAAREGPVNRNPTGAPEGSWSTQNRLLDRVSGLFGLDADEARQQVAVLFGVPLIRLEAAARARGVRRRGRALQLLRQGLDADDLLALGARAGLWGPPYRWCQRRDVLVPVGLSP